MTVTIPLTNTLDYRELRYALRSIDKHLPGYEVVIVGQEMPDWLTNVTWINVPDVTGRKQLSIKRKIFAALEYSGEIFFTNDDIFMLQPIDPYSFPYYYNGIIKQQTEAGCKQLIDELTIMGKPVNHYDVHTPILYRKDFVDVAAQFSDDTVIKSMYANYKGVEGVPLPDLKIMRPVAPEAIRIAIKNRPCFSTGMGGVRSAEIVLKELFGNRSKFEVW